MIKRNVRITNRQWNMLEDIQKYTDQECIRFLKYVNSLSIDVRAKYTVERLYQAYTNGEKL
jgi:hypothetical protein